MSGQGKGWLLVQGSLLSPPSSVWMQVGIALNIVSASNNLPAGLLRESHPMIPVHTYATCKAEALMVGTNRGGRLCSAASES